MPPNFGTENLKRLRQLICCFAISSATFWPIANASAQSTGCSFLPSPEEFNTFPENDKIVIGQIRRQPYVVLLTYNLQDNFPLIRNCIPDAFLTSARLGSYIHIASFSDYRDARDLSKSIAESLGLDIRVIHLNRLRS